MAKAKAESQIGMDDTIIEDTELEEMLEAREELKKDLRNYREQDKKVRAKLNEIEAPSPFRVGRFVITRTATAGRHVEFDTSGGIRVNIKLISED